jgi:hypothetical protein
VAEATDPGSIHVGEAGVGGHVENDFRRILQLGSKQGSLDADAARLEE